MSADRGEFNLNENLAELSDRITALEKRLSESPAQPEAKPRPAVTVEELQVAMEVRLRRLAKENPKPDEWLTPHDCELAALHCARVALDMLGGGK